MCLLLPGAQQTDEHHANISTYLTSLFYFPVEPNCFNCFNNIFFIARFKYEDV